MPAVLNFPLSTRLVLVPWSFKKAHAPICLHLQSSFISSHLQHPHTDGILLSPPFPSPASFQKGRTARHPGPSFLPHSVCWPALAPSCPGGQLAHSARSLTPEYPGSSGRTLALNGLLEATCLCWLQAVLQKVGMGQGSLWDPVQQTAPYLKGHSTLELGGSGIFWSLGTSRLMFYQIIKVASTGT